MTPTYEFPNVLDGLREHGIQCAPDRGRKHARNYRFYIGAADASRQQPIYTACGLREALAFAKGYLAAVTQPA